MVIIQHCSGMTFDICAVGMLYTSTCTWLLSVLSITCYRHIIMRRNEMHHKVHCLIWLPRHFDHSCFAFDKIRLNHGFENIRGCCQDGGWHHYFFVFHQQNDVFLWKNGEYYVKCVPISMHPFLDLLCSVVFCHCSTIPMSFKASSRALGRPCVCTCATEAILENDRMATLQPDLAVRVYWLGITNIYVRRKSDSKKALFKVGQCKQYNSSHLKWVLVAKKHTHHQIQ